MRREKEPVRDWRNSFDSKPRGVVGFGKVKKPNSCQRESSKDYSNNNLLLIGFMAKREMLRSELGRYYLPKYWQEDAI
jgi:hypothetical protein